MELTDRYEIESPDIVFGIVAAVGTPIRYFTRLLGEQLDERRGYDSEVLHLSRYLSQIEIPDAPEVPDGPLYARIDALMSRGNELRRQAGRGDILALLSAAKINAQRSSGPEGSLRPFDRKAFILRQLKHPDEVYQLRRIYGDSFHLIGLYCPERVRRRHLLEDMAENDANTLIERDEFESDKWGQKFRKTFHLADVFIETRGPVEESDPESEREDIARYLDLLFGDGRITPTRDEYGMYLASAAALRSSSMSRQVGAAVLSKQSEVISVGCNEVPCWPGGQYWGDETTGDSLEVHPGDPASPSPAGEARDNRDHVRGRDSSDEMKYKIAKQIAENLDRSVGGDGNGDDGEDQVSEDAVRAVIRELSDTRVMNLTEFTRAVHAEMEALTSAARIGVSVRGATLFTTTFPCHGCAKHIVAAGIQRVVFIEPYPKSLATDLHEDSIELESNEPGHKVQFQPFVGVSPRNYERLFSLTTPEGKRIRRKDEAGRPIEEPLGLQRTERSYSYLEMESIASQEVDEILEEEAEL